MLLLGQAFFARHCKTHAHTWSGAHVGATQRAAVALLFIINWSFDLSRRSLCRDNEPGTPHPGEPLFLGVSREIMRIYTKVGGYCFFWFVTVMAECRLTSLIIFIRSWLVGIELLPDSDWLGA